MAMHHNTARITSQKMLGYNIVNGTVAYSVCRNQWNDGTVDYSIHRYLHGGYTMIDTSDYPLPITITVEEINRRLNAVKNGKAS